MVLMIHSFVIIVIGNNSYLEDSPLILNQSQISYTSKEGFSEKGPSMTLSIKY